MHVSNVTVVLFLCCTFLFENETCKSFKDNSDEQEPVSVRWKTLAWVLMSNERKHLLGFDFGAFWQRFLAVTVDFLLGHGYLSDGLYRT